jgi:hypothetical protein
MRFAPSYQVAYVTGRRPHPLGSVVPERWVVGGSIGFTPITPFSTIAIIIPTSRVILCA